MEIILLQIAGLPVGAKKLFAWRPGYPPQGLLEVDRRAVTPRVCRQLLSTWRLSGTLAASRGRLSTTLNSTSFTSGQAR